jgi:hypothetical protein
MRRTSDKAAAPAWRRGLIRIQVAMHIQYEIHAKPISDFLIAVRYCNIYKIRKRIQVGEI